jgi:hypothetical protein
MLCDAAMREHLLRASSFRPAALAHYRNAQRDVVHEAQPTAPSVRRGAALLAASMALLVAASLVPLHLARPGRVIAWAPSAIVLAIEPHITSASFDVKAELTEGTITCAGELNRRPGDVRLTLSAPCRVSAGASATLRLRTSVWRLLRSRMVRS